jgi:hypothetical protein
MSQPEERALVDIGWDLLDLSDPTSGTLDRRRAPRFAWQTSVSRVSIQDGYLVFETGEQAEVKPSPSMLTNFIELASEQNSVKIRSERLVRFAAHFGPLGLCKQHQFPITAKHVCPPNIRPGNPPATLESARTWLILAARLRVLLQVLACLRSRRPVRRADWAVLSAGTFGAPGVAVTGKHGKLHLRSPEKVPGQRLASRTLAAGVDMLLRISGLRPVCRHRGGRLTLQVEPERPSLIGALAYQVMLLAGKSDGLAFCTACGEPYVPTKRLTERRRNYCKKSDCLAARHRDAMRDHRARATKGRRSRSKRRTRLKLRG